MNYKAQLNGWAVDRATEAHKAGILKLTNIDDLKAAALVLADFGYMPDSDFTDCVQRISQILKESPDALEKVTVLQSELAFVAEDIERQLNLRKTTQQ